MLHGATFFGPNERWKDYLVVEPPKREHVEMGAGRLRPEDYDAMGEVVELPRAR